MAAPSTVVPDLMDTSESTMEDAMEVEVQHDDHGDDGEDRSYNAVVTNNDDLNMSSPQNPMLIEDVLDKILPYFDDKENLCSFRQVCKVWKKSSSRIVKKNLVWKLGPDPGSESNFMEVMSSCTDDMFRNFHLASKNSETEENHADGIDNFLQKFGPTIATLKLSGKDPLCIERRLRSSWLPNLEHLELYHLSRTTLAYSAPFVGIQHFPRLESLHFSTDEYPYDASDFEKPDGRICFDIIEACASTLKSVRTNLSGTLSKLLTRSMPAIESLNTSSSFQHVSSPRNAVVALDEIDVKNLTENYRNLKYLSAPVPLEVPLRDVLAMLAKSAGSLETMHICICEAVNAEDEEEDVNFEIYASGDEAEEENDEKDDKPILMPEFPQMKRATLHNWTLLQNSDLFTKMPKLEYLDLSLHRHSSLLRTPPSTAQQNLKSLHFSHETIDSQTVFIISKSFPNLSELDLKLESDEGLTFIFKFLRQLKTLCLNRSKITDCGITGLSREEMQYAFETRLCWDGLDAIRLGRPFVGDLKELEKFVYDGKDLTKFSLYFGIARLKELRHLTLGCHLEILETDGKKQYNVHPIDVSPLIAYCQYLSKLDVTYVLSIHEEMYDAFSYQVPSQDSLISELSLSVSNHEASFHGADEDAGSDEDKEICLLCPLCSKIFSGVQITSESIALLRQAFPNLELCYDFSS